MTSPAPRIGKRQRRAGGGWPAVAYTLSKAIEVGPWKLWQRMRSRNACKTCAVGMGGQKGGMVNEAGHFPEVCKKSLQAQVADMKGAVTREFLARTPLNHLLTLTPKQAEDLGRITEPLILRPQSEHLEPLSWEEALAISGAALKATSGDRVAFYASGRSSNEAGFLLQSFARIYGSPHIMNCSYYCHQASGIGLQLALGTGTATVELADLDRADFVMLIGANPASNHPRLMTKLADLRKRGGQVVVVNPLREPGLERFHVPSDPLSLIFGSEIASQYLQILPGGDVALLVGLLKALLDAGMIEHDFLAAHANGWQEVMASVEATPWSEIVMESGVDRNAIDAAAKLLAAAKGAIFAWAMGITHHAHGVDNVLAITNLAVATGNIGKPGAGLLPIRGHSNVQGMGSIGFTPSLKQGVLESLTKVYGLNDSEHKLSAGGYDTYAMMQAAGAGKIDALVVLGGNLYGSNPNLSWAAGALQSIDTTVYVSTKFNPGHFHGRGRTTIYLPVLTRDEEPQATTQESMFNFVRLSEGGQPNLKGDMRAESLVICQLANQVLGNTPVDWLQLADLSRVRKFIAATIPGWQPLATMDETRSEFTVPGRVLHEPRFPTHDGKVQMQATPLPDLAIPSDAFRLITLRSEGQFNTVVYEENDLYRGMPHRYCILIHPDDARTLGITDGATLTVRGESGIMPNIEAVCGPIKQGSVAMFYPEANQLLGSRIDPRSHTPAFKSAPVWLEPARGASPI